MNLILLDCMLETSSLQDTDCLCSRSDVESFLDLNSATYLPVTLRCSLILTARLSYIQ